MYSNGCSNRFDREQFPSRSGRAIDSQVSLACAGVNSGSGQYKDPKSRDDRRIYKLGSLPLPRAWGKFGQVRATIDVKRNLSRRSLPCSDVVLACRSRAGSVTFDQGLSTLRGARTKRTRLISATDTVQAPSLV